MSINSGDSVEWTWISPDFLTGLLYKVEQLENSVETNRVGFSSGSATSQGNFTFQFNKPGVFFYWSGYINADKDSFRGVIQVNDTNDEQLELDVYVDEFKGFKLC